MQRAKKLLAALLYPKAWMLVTVPPLSFAALAWHFAAGRTNGTAAYALYTLSAYSLTIWLAAAPGLFRRMAAASAQAVRCRG